MIVVGNTSGRIGVQEAMRVLKAGGSVIDAVEAGIRLVEADPDNHTVGYGGYPNLLGQVELDASIMEGRGRTAGAVGALRGYRHPISVARRVMENLPHVFLVGLGAERFAKEMGFEREDLLTEPARQLWEKRMATEMSEQALARLADQPQLWQHAQLTADPERPQGTVNLVAQDEQGRICVGASTSGWALKYPGRLGDSPVIGAGIYADDRYGAAACTGMGEMAIRTSTARSVVLYLKMGWSLRRAGREVMEDLNQLGGLYLSRMNVLVLDRDGRHGGFSSTPDETYVFMTAAMSLPEAAPRTWVPVGKRWGEPAPEV